MNLSKTRNLFILFCVLSVSGISCKKFLAAYSQNNSFIERAADLDELLVGECYYPLSLSIPEMMYTMDDDVTMGKPGNNSSDVLKTELTGFYFWQPRPRTNTDGTVFNTDNFFTEQYGRIASLNTILYNIPLLKDKGESVDTLKRIAGEAHFLRAFYYFILENLYGKPYKSATAESDFGIPLKTDPEIKDQFASRSTTGQVYDQILADLLSAENELSGINARSSIRANLNAVHALLSRVYLFMENYEKAILYADKVIGSGDYHLTDLNNHIEGEDFLTRNAEEVIFTMGRNPFSAIMFINIDPPPGAFYRVSDDLAASYSPEDLRRDVFFVQTSSGYLKLGKKRKDIYSNIDDVSVMFLLRLSELYLNKAEALAVLGRFEEARAALQELRSGRFRPDELIPVISEGAMLVNDIRDERRRELCFESQRWFDLRRYGVNSEYPFSKSIRHISYAFTGSGYDENGYYELEPYQKDASAYVVPIANDEIEFNQGLLTNEPRPERPLKQ